MKNKKRTSKQMMALGSKTARAGFSNERDVARKFEDWKNDPQAKEWLVLMGYKIKDIEKVEVVILPNKFKADIQVQITIYLKRAISAENLSIKLVSNKSGGNQIDKRWVEDYRKMWDIPDDLTLILKKYTGEVKSKKRYLKDRRRMFFEEMSKRDVIKVIDFFTKNKVLIVLDLIKGRGVFSAGWIIVVHKFENKTRWVLKSINHALNIFSNGDVKVTKPKKGNLKIGRVSMQRKGGDGGRPSANMLQFKINPLELF